MKIFGDSNETYQIVFDPDSAKPVLQFHATYFDQQITIERGFISHGEIILEDWMQSGAELLVDHPIESLINPDREPAIEFYDGKAVYRWFEDRSERMVNPDDVEMIPRCIFHLLEKSIFDSVDAAMIELGNASLRLGKDESRRTRMGDEHAITPALLRYWS